MIPEIDNTAFDFAIFNIKTSGRRKPYYFHSVFANQRVIPNFVDKNPAPDFFKNLIERKISFLHHQILGIKRMLQNSACAMPFGKQIRQHAGFHQSRLSFWKSFRVKWNSELSWISDVVKKRKMFREYLFSQ